MRFFGRNVVQRGFLKKILIRQHKKKRKIYPTVATSDDFMEHQRLVLEEKQKKELEKSFRMEKRICNSAKKEEKKKENLLKKQKKTVKVTKSLKKGL